MLAPPARSARTGPEERDGGMLMIRPVGVIDPPTEEASPEVPMHGSCIAGPVVLGTKPA